MEFDKSRIYTAVNADEVKVGSKCFYEWSLKYLKEDVENNNEQDIGIVTEIYDESQIYRFQIDNCIDREEISDGAFALIYLIEPPKESQYKPFSSVEKAREAIDKHGGWVKRKKDGYQYILIGIAQLEKAIRLGDNLLDTEELFEDYVFVDDGSPCGELVEE